MIKKITALFAMLMLTIFMAACGPSGPLSTATAGALGAATAVIPSGTEVMSAVETVAAGPVVSTINVDELTAMVNDFVNSGDITGQAENGLLAKLETIQQKLLNGQLEAASNEMGAFVNEVQAQMGKKISDPAATALIAKAQEVAAELLAGVPVTGEGGTVIPVAPENMSLPVPLGDQLEHQVQWDAVAREVAESAGVSTFSYELFQLPVNSSWEETLAYYQTQAAEAGWGDGPRQTNEMAGGHYAVWSVTGSDGVVRYFIVAQADAPDGTFTVNIFGK